MIFQDPYASLNPRKRVGQIVGDPLKLHGLASGRELKSQVGELLERVGLGAEHYNRFPHEFSGGQRQRIGIARALALRPKLIIADEPVSALDVSIQAQIINLLDDLQDEFKLTYIFVAHDLGVIRHVSDRIAVMYLGKIVEIGPAEEVYNQADPPLHALAARLAADPGPEGERGARADGARGRPAEPGQSARRLPLSHPLSLRNRDLLRGRAAARPPRPRPLGCLPPPARPRASRSRERGVAASLTLTLAIVLVFTEAVLLARGRVAGARGAGGDRGPGARVRSTSASEPSEPCGATIISESVGQMGGRRAGRSAITVAVALVATLSRDGPSEATEHGLRLDQPGSPPGGGVPLHVARVAARVERIRGLSSSARRAFGS